jgi:hypothetical protein
MTFHATSADSSVYVIKSYWFGLVLVIALRLQTPKHFRGWPHDTNTSEQFDGNEGQNMVTV